MRNKERSISSPRQGNALPQNPWDGEGLALLGLAEMTRCPTMITGLIPDRQRAAAAG
jgi:hypothetical protein